MKKFWLLPGFILLLGYAYAYTGHNSNNRIAYHLDLNKLSNKAFDVVMDVSGLLKADSIFQFVATAPGVYSILDIGRFVKQFSAKDGAGNLLRTEKISVNQWKISSPEQVKKIVYTIGETLDPAIRQHVVVPYAGSSIYDDHVVFAGHAVFGYFPRLISTPVRLSLTCPKDWITGTALLKDRSGDFIARSYTDLVDNPFMLGRLSTSESVVNGTKIFIYTYSRTDKIKASQLTRDIDSVVMACAAFMGRLPVDRYTFLYSFNEPRNHGALEFTHSSLYSYSEDEYAAIRSSIRYASAHEFLHLLTPLRIRSGVIDQYNWVVPSASEHLWLYEGFTEWATYASLMRFGLMDLDEYLSIQKQKLTVDEFYFDAAYSLSTIALETYTDEGNLQNGNMYNRGPVAIGLLDIRLLELSGGKLGMREIVNQLAKSYKPGKPFNEKDFYDLLVRITYPETREFIDEYFKHSNPLPLEQLYGKLGIKYAKTVKIDGIAKDIGIMGIDTVDNTVRVTGVSVQGKLMGLLNDDEIMELNGATITTENVIAEAGALIAKPAGTSFEITVKRKDKKYVLPCKVNEYQAFDSHVFTLEQTRSKAQDDLRKAWMKKL
jgi:predicted metalloprotease with PDZ domain